MSSFHGSIHWTQYRAALPMFFCIKSYHIYCDIKLLAMESCKQKIIYTFVCWCILSAASIRNSSSWKRCCHMQIPHWSHSCIGHCIYCCSFHFNSSRMVICILPIRRKICPKGHHVPQYNITCILHSCSVSINTLLFTITHFAHRYKVHIVSYYLLHY